MSMLEGSLEKNNSPGANIGLILSPGQKLLFLCANALPLLHAGLIVTCLLYPSSPIAKLLATLCAILILPIFAVRLTFLLFGKPEGEYAIGEKKFFVWWFTMQYQVLFCRIPIIEECIRLVPGLYSFWLRLWGSRIGALTYWAPGTVILDRSYLTIGDHVILGAGVRLNPHVLSKNENGKMVLLLAPVTIGSRSSVGGYSLLTAGSTIMSGETSVAFLRLPPFNVLTNGKRIKPDAMEVL